MMQSVANSPHFVEGFVKECEDMGLPGWAIERGLHSARLNILMRNPNFRAGFTEEMNKMADALGGGGIGSIPPPAAQGGGALPSLARGGGALPKPVAPGSIPPVATSMTPQEWMARTMARPPGAPVTSLPGSAPAILPDASVAPPSLAQGGGALPALPATTTVVPDNLNSELAKTVGYKLDASGRAVRVPPPMPPAPIAGGQ